MTERALAQIDVAVLAGGLGTRLRPVLADRPKILAPVEGRPFIDYMFKWLASFGASRVVLCLGHLSEKVADYLKANPAPFEVQLSVETEPAGTACALRLARPTLKSDPVLVINGDSFVDADLGKAVAAHRANDAAATLICPQVEDTSRFGRVEVDRNGHIVRFVEKAATKGSGFINGGVYLFSPAFLDEIGASGARSLENDVLAKQPSGRLHALTGSFRFIDIGLPETLQSARADTLTRVGPR